MITGIYGLQNKVKPDKWYVGLSKNITIRWRKAYKNLQCKRQYKIYNALLKYGYDGFEKIVLEECDASTLSEREIYWIKKLNSVRNGYNLTSGGYSGSGETLKGKKLTDEHKKKLSVCRIGKNQSKETCLKISATLTGRKMSNDARKKLSEALTGRIFSEKHRLNISNSLIGRKKSAEHCKKLSLARIGKKHSEETRNKISEARRNQRVVDSILETDSIS